MSIKFGTAGWRGIIAQDFTFENVQKCAQALANHLLKSKITGKIVIAHDSRFMGRKFAEAAASVMQANGFTPLIISGNTPTPVAGFAVKHLNAIGGINFTASHNPPEYQGFKYITSWGGLASSAETSSIEQELASVQVKTVEPTIEEIDVTDAFLSSLLKVLPQTQRKLSILVNPMFGTAAEYLPALLEKLGHNVTTMQMAQDPLFGGISPDPQEKNLTNMQDMLKEGNFDLGLATDADADRFGVLDAEGNFFHPNDVLALLVDALSHDLSPKAIGMAHVTGSIVERTAQINNIEVIKTAVGFKNLGALMQEGKTALGCEESSGFAWGSHLNDKDGIAATALMAQILSNQENDLKTLRQDLYTKVGEKFSTRLDLRLTESGKTKLIETLQTNAPKSFDNSNVEEEDRLDAQRFVLEDGRWIAFRPSGTEPLVRVYMDAPSAESLNDLQQFAQEFIQKTTV